MTEDLREYVLEMEEQMRIIQREVLDLNAYMAVLSDMVSPGLSQRFAEHMRFIREASSDILEIWEGEA